LTKPVLKTWEIAVPTPPLVDALSRWADVYAIQGRVIMAGQESDVRSSITVGHWLVSAADDISMRRRAIYRRVNVRLPIDGITGRHAGQPDISSRWYTLLSHGVAC